MWNEIVEALNDEAQVFIANWDAAMFVAGKPPVTEQVIEVLDYYANLSSCDGWSINQRRLNQLLAFPDILAYRAIVYPMK